MKATYINLDGSEFEGPLFNSDMEIVALDRDGNLHYYQTTEIVRTEIEGFGDPIDAEECI